MLLLSELHNLLDLLVSDLWSLYVHIEQEVIPALLFSLTNLLQLSLNPLRLLASLRAGTLTRRPLDETLAADIRQLLVSWVSVHHAELKLLRVEVNRQSLVLLWNAVVSSSGGSP